MNYTQTIFGTTSGSVLLPLGHRSTRKKGREMKRKKLEIKKKAHQGKKVDGHLSSMGERPGNIGAAEQIIRNRHISERGGGRKL